MTPEELTEQIMGRLLGSVPAELHKDIPFNYLRDAIIIAIRKAILESHHERCEDEGHQFLKTKCIWCGTKGQ